MVQWIIIEEKLLENKIKIPYHYSMTLSCI